jgi:hypothetical protein
VTALDDNSDSLTHAAVGFDACTPQVIEAAQDVLMPERREGKV